MKPEKRSEVNRQNANKRWKDHVPKQQVSKFGQLPKATDWSGRNVRLKGAVWARNGVRIPKGTEMSVVRVYGGLTLAKAENCPCCGCGRRDIVDRVPYDQVELVHVCEHGLEDCVMTGPHMESECHTVEMAEAMENEALRFETMQPDEQGFE